mmetsp:Transcript_21826/g.30585  ORF Transcript_21826/g.30585 Transcript_21826/m.30585 type:complete len:163 (+) Transcript_21826:416-904(+)|eukprot:CAMPEP_0185272970 /NCGR_PEP_ID=MMETSP1359-20130426/48517_1 /TAXON_ID=552665 /ORGANISM="Bigelowiella longifila, Strain CCMP242" /LENGTH=162 /DNA_ID=CAMNT_0027865445 /DNA_START=152 /DNA_END=640 /DNA_ORIENTATION=+
MESLGDSKTSSSSSSSTDSNSKRCQEEQTQLPSKPSNKGHAVQSALQSIVSERGKKCKKTTGEDGRRWSCPPPGDDEKYFNGFGWKVIERGLDRNARYPKGIDGYMHNKDTTSVGNRGGATRNNAISSNSTTMLTSLCPPRPPRPVPNTYVLVVARAEDCCT